jgi:hypothetical protein
VPVPRLFEAPTDPRDAWVHVIGAVLGLGGEDTRAALLAELAGEELPGAGAANARLRTALAGTPVDLLARDADSQWAVVVAAGLAFDADEGARLAAAHDSAADLAERVVTVALTADRRPPAAVEAAGGDGRDVRHRSWLRLRDWVQERPERAGAQGVDLLLLREAEYFLTPRVAELYRLEGVMPAVAPELRPTLASTFFDLNDLSPAPRIIAGANGDGTRVVFPRSGDPAAEIVVGSGAIRLRLATSEAGPGFEPDDDPGWSVLRLATPETWRAARSWVQTTAVDILPAPRA